jgi:hypothetical protein
VTLLFLFPQLQGAAPKTDTTITYDEVATLIGVNIPFLEPQPTFEKIRIFCCHFKQAFQRLPCPQSTQYGWKGLIISRELYALLIGPNNAFRLHIDPGLTANYTWPVAPGAYRTSRHRPIPNKQQLICVLRIKTLFLSIANYQTCMLCST